MVSVDAKYRFSRDSMQLKIIVGAFVFAALFLSVIFFSLNKPGSELAIVLNLFVPPLVVLAVLGALAQYFVVWPGLYYLELTDDSVKVRRGLVPIALETQVDKL